MSSTITINGKSYTVSLPATIIEVADQIGTYIPRFCYHKKLSVAANCRMCLVDVEGFNKPLPACATPLTPDMKIWTRSSRAKAAQQAVMEFLLINHPLDCPICDQGGECELQDLAMRYSRSQSSFSETKRVIPKEDLGSLIATEMTRCIQCTRCVRFGHEISGHKELGATGRGEDLQITTYVRNHLRSELSGNMIDLCPVGALTSKPFQFQARPWELRQVPSILSHDCLGSHAYLHTDGQKILRVVPREKESINETWLSDRDRYAYLGLNNKKRLLSPMIKLKSGWQETDWPTALGQVASHLNTVLKQYGGHRLGGLISPSATLEELYFFQQLCRGLGSNHIDHRLHQTDTRDQSEAPLYPKTELNLTELEHCDVILLIGSNPQREQPLLVTRLRRAVQRGARIVSINCIDYPLSFKTHWKWMVSPDHLLTYVVTLANYCGAPSSEAGIQTLLDHVELKTIAEVLKASKKIAILTGAVAMNHPQSTNLRYWIDQLTRFTSAKKMPLTEGANSAGAWMAGAVPHRGVGGQAINSAGFSTQEMFKAQMKAYLLFNIDPSLDCACPVQAQSAMQAADCVVAFSLFKSNDLLKQADILLPIAGLGELSGTLINVEGKGQSFEASIPLPGHVRSGKEVLQTLSSILKINGEDECCLESLGEDIQKKCHEKNVDQTSSSIRQEPQFTSIEPYARQGHSLPLLRITEWALYSIDPMVRHSEPLQMAGSCEKTGAYIHTHLAQRLKLKEKQWVRLRQAGTISDPMPVFIDNKVPENCIWTPAGREEMAQLADSFGEIEILSEKSI